jgi:hypothetical protein
LAKSQLLVIYHAELDGNLGSEWSGPACPYMLTIHNAVMAALVIVPNKGYHTCRTNITALTKRIKVESTETTRLKDVKL